jgi:hypothetical protein
MTPSTLRHEFLAAEFDCRIAGVEPLLNIANWYAEQYHSTENFDLRLDHGDWDCSAAERAALRLDYAGFKSEAEIATRPCECADRRENECTRYTALKDARAALAHIVHIFDAVERKLGAAAREVMRARGAKVIPHHIGLWPAMLFLAPLGDELAQGMLARVLRPRPDHDDTPLAEIIFQDCLYITLLYAALAAHPDHAAGDRDIVWRWHLAGIEVAESARLVAWFRATHPMQAHRIERDLKLKLRKRGWRV